MTQTTSGSEAIERLREKDDLDVTRGMFGLRPYRREVAGHLDVLERAAGSSAVLLTDCAM